MADEKITIKVDGILDDHMAETLLTLLSSVPGAKYADLSMKDGVATVEFDSSIAGPEDFLKAITDTGYGAVIA